MNKILAIAACAFASVTLANVQVTPFFDPLTAPSKNFGPLVAGDEPGYKAVNYSQLPLLLVQAVRELKAENEIVRKDATSDKEQLLRIVKEQQAQIELLMSEMEQLKARLGMDTTISK
jgi:hypothetical protein